jgi:hypothetical protein
MIHAEQDLLESVSASSLMSAPVRDEGWHRPEYVFTRFVADCARIAGFDSIKYPSSRSHKGHNLVIVAQGQAWDKVVCPSVGRDCVFVPRKE